MLIASPIKRRGAETCKACTFSPYPRSFVIISLSVCSTLMHRRSSFSSSSCLVCLISLVRDKKKKVEYSTWPQRLCWTLTAVNRAYFDMNPPLSHFLRASVFSGKSSSGRCRTSTSTDSSAWTSGLSRSSRADTMSCQWYKDNCPSCSGTLQSTDVDVFSTRSANMTVGPES